MMHNWFRHVFARFKEPRARTPRRIGSFRPTVECLEDRLAPAAFIVTSTVDGSGTSLRDAINAVNAGTDNAIDFAIPGSGVQVLTFSSALPTINNPVTIDGTTQGVSASPLIELAGVGLNANGLTIGTSAGGSTVTDLSIVGFKMNGIELDSSNNTVTRCYLGMLPDGSTPAGNAVDGVFINGNGANTPSGNTIGGATAAAGNLLSANGTGLFGVGSGGSGVDIDGSGASNNLVENNLIGTDITGTLAKGNFSGVFIGDSATFNTVGGANVISGNQQGVVITGSNSISNTVQGNLIGLNKAGTAAVGNAFEGVLIQTSTINTISGNTISGNQNGLTIFSNAYANTVQANFIGTNQAGTAAIPNTANGVLIDSAAGNTIGGTSAAQANVISNNSQRGVVLTGTTAASNTVEGNTIQSNGFQDIYITNGARNNTIGSTNVVAFSGGAGILVGADATHPAVSPGPDSPAGAGNAILSNSIFSNTAAGIVIGAGSNLNQAAPVLTSTPIVSNGASPAMLTNLSFTLSGPANTSYTIQFFASNAADNPSQGRNFLGSLSETTNGSGNLTVSNASINPAVPVAFGQIITATATSSANNSSAFSNGKTVTFQDTVGIYDVNNAVFHLSNIQGNPGFNDYGFFYGAKGWKPLAGDFTGAGKDTVGVFDNINAIFHITTTIPPKGGTATDTFAFQYGGTNWDPLAGNFFNVGTNTVGVFDTTNAVFHLSHSIGNPGGADYAFQYGGTNWVPIAGDFFGLGHATVGVFDPVNAVFHLSNVLANPGSNDYAFFYGSPGWVPFAGDFTGTGKDTVGLYDQTNGIFHIITSLPPQGSHATDSFAFQYGGTPWLPVAGLWAFPGFQLAAGGEARVPSGAAALTESQLQTEAQVALNLLAGNGVNSALLAKLGSLQFTVGQLPAGVLGLSYVAAGTVEISADAAGYGWFVDTDPLHDPAFVNGVAQPGSAAANRIDLLTVVLHEMGHFNGWTELDPATNPDALMALTLGTGQRRIDALDAVFAAGF